MDFSSLVLAFFGALRRRIRLFVLLFLALLTGVVAAAYVKPQQFRSQAEVLISFQSPRVNSSRSEETQITALLQPDEILAAQVELMQTRDVIEALIDRLPIWVFEQPEGPRKWYHSWLVDPLKGSLDAISDGLVRVGLMPDGDPRYDRIRTIEKGLTIFPVRKAQIIEVAFRARDPDVPPVVIETLLDIYQEKLTRLRSTREGVALYENQARELSEELANAEALRAVFMAKHGIRDLDAERRDLMQRLAERKLRVDEERLQELQRLEPDLNAMTRQVAILEDSYGIYRRAAADRRAFFERDGEIMAQVIDPPSRIYAPLKPSRLTLIILGAVASVLIAMGAVVFVEWIATLRRMARAERPPLALADPVDVKGN